ncbi:MAG TPA: L-aspartate oxidase [Ktedonobacteraceae bacterium]|jgi:L-aspartate oxidase
MRDSRDYDVAIVGGGIAGLTVALRLPGALRVGLFTKGLAGESNTRYAQGGLTVALGRDDSPQLHLQDTLAAGAGLCDISAARILAYAAPAAVRWLISMGVHFDRALPGDAHASADGLLLGREAAHSRWRILHAGGDATGAEIERALVAALKEQTHIQMYPETFVQRLLSEDGACVGLEALDRAGHTLRVRAPAVVLANGGAGGLWLYTSNPAGATADGLALAWRAGAALTDLEFMQFHPTVLAGQGGSHLITEAVRGEGAYLRNHAGERFMPRYHKLAELAPRDVVARAIGSEMLAEGTQEQYLDLRHLDAARIYQRFPTISAICRAQGLDLARDLLPVAPAAHYCMGGILTDTYGRSTLPGLYAVGEVACTGVHGANRLASNSLLEGLVFGLRLADELAGLGERAAIAAGRTALKVRSALAADADLLYIQPDEQRIGQINNELRHLMWRAVSLRREEEGLREAGRLLRTLGRDAACVDTLGPAPPATPMAWRETANMLLVAELVIAAALRRRESRGSHWRSDYPCADERMAGTHLVFYPEHAWTNWPSRSQEVTPYA